MRDRTGDLPPMPGIFVRVGGGWPAGIDDGPLGGRTLAQIRPRGQGQRPGRDEYPHYGLAPLEAMAASH
jgi:hypothetical protein